MKNIGSVGGKVEILVEPDGIAEAGGSRLHRVSLAATSNLIALSPSEAIDLGYVISRAALGIFEFGGEASTFRPKKD